MWNKKYVIYSVIFFIFAIVCLAYLLTDKFQSYYLCGAIVFLLLGVAFLRNARH